MHEEDNIIPITRGKPARLQVVLSSGPASVGFQVQRKPDPVRTAGRGGPDSRAGMPVESVLEFRPRTQKGNQNVKMYRIDDDNRVQVLPEGTVRDGAVFTGVEELEQLVAAWPVRRLVEIWNELPGVRPVDRFENRNVAVQRIWQALQARTDQPQQPRRKRERPVRESKTQMVLRMLRAPEGTTLDALMKATRWQAHSVRGFLSGKVSKQLALPV